MKLGKTPARPGAAKLQFSAYLGSSKIPPLPSNFGHEALISEWGMLGNDKYGCCVLAGGAHETMLWNACASRKVAFSEDSVLSDYSAITGFNPADPNTDQGTDMEVAAKYRRQTGLIDASGVRHKIGAYLALTPGNLREFLYAIRLFGIGGIGVEMPASAMDQFNQGKPWSVVRGSSIEGGHYIPGVAKRKGKSLIVTWAALQPMTVGFFSKYNDESLVYLSEEMLTNGRSLENFDLDTLRADLNALTGIK